MAESDAGALERSAACWAIELSLRTYKNGYYDLCKIPPLQVQCVLKQSEAAIVLNPLGVSLGSRQIWNANARLEKRRASAERGFPSAARLAVPKVGHWVLLFDVDPLPFPLSPCFTPGAHPSSLSLWRAC